jgi:hypothetical protein
MTSEGVFGVTKFAGRDASSSKCLCDDHHVRFPTTVSSCKHGVQCYSKLLFFFCLDGGSTSEAPAGTQ